MAEYAKKEALISVLPPRLGHGDVYALGHNTCRNMVEMIIKDFPAADVVAVVRCKDCAWSRQVDGREPKYCCVHLKCGSEQWVHSNDFCSYGERRGDNG